MGNLRVLALSLLVTVCLTSSLVASEKGTMKASEKGSMKKEMKASDQGSMKKEMKASEAVTYEIDSTHSTLGFAVKHLGVGTTRGGFGNYQGTISYDPNNFDSFNADVTIKSGSIDTRLEARDKHLKSPDFFDTENHPTITFKSKRLEKRGVTGLIVGDLTMKGITKEIKIPVQISGPVKSPFGGNVIGINGQTSVNRQDFGISWSKTMDAGGLVVADNVLLVVEIEAHHKG